MSIQQNFSAVSPSLSLNFARSKQLDSRITFTRSSTATYMDSQGIIRIAPIDSPRFDHSYNSSTGSYNSLGLLLEESRTNIQSYSIPDSSNWTTFGATLTENNAISPDGTLTATLFTGTTDNAHFIYRDQTISSSTTYTQSYFVKAGTTNYVQIAPSTGFNSSYQNFDLGNGVLGNGDISTYGGTASITAYPNGWYRISVTMTSTSGGSGRRMVLASITSATDLRLDSDENKTFYVWGAQLETGEFPTSYIPTTSATVTRSADDASITGTNFSNWYNQSEGTLIGKLKKTSVGIGFGYEIATFQTSSPNRLIITHNLSDDVVCSISDSTATGATTINLLSTAPLNTDYTIGLAYSPNDSAACYNGNVAVADTIEGATGTMFRLKFGRVSTNYSSVGTGWLDSFKYYPVRLSNSQLENHTK